MHLRRIAFTAALVSALLPGAPAARASVACGGIFEDTTWAAAASPIAMTCDVYVYQGATLTIEPGVTVQAAAGVALHVRGRLVAEGTADARIVLTSSSPPSLWGGVAVETNQGGSAVVRFADVSYASQAFSVQCCWGAPRPLELADATITHSSCGLCGYAGSRSVARRVYFADNTYGVTNADWDVYESTFERHQCAVCYTERVNVYSSTLRDNVTAVYGGRGVLQGSLVTGNGTGVQAFFEGMTISRSTITANGVGVVLPSYGRAAPVRYNNIFANTTYNARLTGPDNQDLAYNWWGTTTPADIEAGIYDARDQAGLGLATYQPFLSEPVTADTTPPDTLISSGPPALTNSSTATFEFTATEPSTFECALDGGAYAACSSPKTYSGLADGSHTFAVRATDNDGNQDPTPATFTWTVDTIPPDTTITSGPAGLVNSGEATFTFEASEAGSAFSCALDDAPFEPCSSPVTYSGLADGGHVFAVRATDPAGNPDPSPALHTWRVDSTPPEVRILRPAPPGVYVLDNELRAGTDTPVAAGPLTVVVRAADAGSGLADVSAEVDGERLALSYDPASGTWRATWAGYGPGLHTIVARARDRAGWVSEDQREVLGLVG